ncbi:D-gamma-glutamyl-meso-diaminopimelic acid endopeptidase CwlS precursor,membrane-bound lytic murein transglycosylase D,stage VI sporulation protein D,LysM domain [Chlamydia serpentis]|uniref:D-gamma-glutamyl-meso-diaminopimelic acid endopeptidase CwlS,membrane-bound lytic murein transglycosylase D,stage VI sporulation protein D,LysM domain n=1 Tax=Chlamydia serpentis TaxID=1967782 RepID=A0A2R8FCF1_9CHLA|nr:LysM peptidoglycan-binding domain-containing protein [Chlamydia serpentis]SPN74012.1 D-gamma-glutamyl-meso-diaminopimelic acid endopeptidase CwlS precursor,membrane-bound lytic murein transglycosylase D,stage VI sporulation protein D,LysM domain [Chlamydia serpentis]
MNRRDMVITAVVVNAMLLIALFVTSKRVGVKDYNEGYRNFAATKVAQGLVSEEKVLEKPSVIEAPVRPVVKETLATQFIESKPVIVTTLPVPVVSESPESVITTVPSQPVNETLKEEQAVYATVVVKKGDFLERIAKANHTTVAKLMQINDLTTTQLKIGQVIKVPILQEIGSQKNSQMNVSNSENYYTVQEGDSPWTIALRNHIRLDDLLKMNDLDEYKARRLKPGDQLRIR